MAAVVQALSWVFLLVKASVSQRKKARKLALDGIEHFKKGGPSKEGKDLVKDLKKNYHFVGFAPNVIYVKESGPKQDLKYQWVHPFSVPTLLYKHKKLPMLVMVNGNLDLNDSRLRKIGKNVKLDELQNILGITG